MSEKPRAPRDAAHAFMLESAPYRLLFKTDLWDYNAQELKSALIEAGRSLTQAAERFARIVNPEVDP